MRVFALMVAAVGVSALGIAGPVSAQNYVTGASYTTGASGYVCPKCGKVHARTGNSQQSRNVQTSYSAPSNGGQLRGGGGIQNVLSTLNAQRARQGVGALQYDPTLQAVAQRRAQRMASMGIKSHPPGSFSPGRYEGVGWSSSYSPSGVSACFTNDRRMTAAGAAMATGRDGVYFAVVYR